jgi:2-polyprenyl-3-methyl-5-hydroxy-6-metoxy-1,4-benzoquinol methylase
MAEGISEGAVLSFFGDHFKRLWRRALGQPPDTPGAAVTQGAGDPLFRRSSGLREFWKVVQGAPGLEILDMGAASQANVTFITDLGYKLYTADILQSMLLSLSEHHKEGDTQSEGEGFFSENLNFAADQFDGILCWDLLDFVADPLIKPLVERLHRCLKPGGTLLCFFHTGAAGLQVPLYQYRIRAEDTLQMAGRGTGPLQRHFNNRTIENLFRNFSSLKFYLSRDSLREVISVR